ncbi:MAG: Coenzyme F420 hydrogenase/dehydrogenase, beta subunit C-terminal domain [Paludibacteraceae bacterium]
MRSNISGLDSSKCSGCGLCVNICPKNLISLQKDELGFIRPVVDNSRCLECGLCLKQCIIVSPMPAVQPIETYAAVRQDKEKIGKSSSGGIFAALAECALSKGWMVAGCILDNKQNPCHTLTTDKTLVEKMYGSKYVQSDIVSVYEDVLFSLQRGHHVLFSGTPCQIAAIKRYTKNHENLITAEVICHGVPNKEMFLSYLNMYDLVNIKKFEFRDKSQGWSFNNLFVYKNGKLKRLNHRLSSYMTYFLEGEIYRDSCYECPYAKPERVADITLGDFWGVVGQRPDLKKVIDIEKGVSCLLVNTSKGAELINHSGIEKFEVIYSTIQHGNGPLNHPSRHTLKRAAILGKWATNRDWSDVHGYWKRNDYRLSYLFWSKIPTKLQHKIRLLLGKR